MRFRCTHPRIPREPRKGKRQGRCKKCKRDVHLTFHHILPRWIYGKMSKKKIGLCSGCHRDLERTIQREEMRILRESGFIYTDAYQDFIRGGSAA